ncbi:MAG: FUSC family protein [Stellaceae bacterium]
MQRGGKAGAEVIAARLAHYRFEIKLSLRITAAGIITYVIVKLLGLEQGYWAVLTAVIVMQASLGGSLKAMLDRLAGTIAGAAAGIIVALIVPRTGAVTGGLALVLALVPLSALVAFKPAYRVAPVTAVIVVLIAQGPALSTGLARAFEIALGTVIAFAVALLFLPSRAYPLLLEAARDALAAISRLVATLLDNLDAPPEDIAVHALHARIRGAIERADGIAREAARERSSHISDSPDPEPIVRTLRRASHDLVMISRVRSAALSEPIRALLTPPAAAVSAAVRDFLTGLDAALAGRGAAPATAAIGEAMQQYGAAMAEVRRQGLTRDLPAEAAEPVFGLAFALEQLCGNLQDLGERIAEAMGRADSTSAARAEPQ